LLSDWVPGLLGELEPRPGQRPEPLLANAGDAARLSTSGAA
jgi:hypothetical protein